MRHKQHQSRYRSQFFQTNNSFNYFTPVHDYHWLK